MGFINHKEYVIIKKHFVVLFFPISKFIFRWLITLSLTLFVIYFKEKIWDEIVQIFFYPLIIIFLTYSFFAFIQSLIVYYNNLVIFVHDKIIIFRSSLFLQDDLEIIDVSKIMKIDVQMHWVFSNLLWYGNLVIEQQRDELFTLHFVPDPYRALQLLREKTAYLHTSDDISFFKVK